MAASQFANTYHLQTVTTKDGEDIDTSVGDFVFEITQGDTDDRLAMSFKIGNNMSTRFELTGGEGDSRTAQFGFVRSTRMAVPEHLFRLVNFFTKDLSDMNSIQLEGDVLTIEGNGKITMKK
eukprot:CAMPEP_0198108872 /NCGR_PEP_ID=MMETSP1442-20131203/901_1 /TAXON_ID= /ORGANISM="Craspedostauros australis, Strain CCMP3328" /LENGTH=121 /DNA_ID=CAMNT_0043764273 /DNA_START=190 /DNA_END=555 /DNA_ORIENTATION=+